MLATPLSDQRPKAGSKTGRVWELADMLTQKHGRKAKRQEVITTYISEGGNTATASTQYDLWQKAFDKLVPPVPHTHSPKGVSIATTLQIGADGRLLVPLELRSQMNLGPDGKVSARLEDGELRLVSPRSALERLQALVKAQDQAQGSVVDEFLAERKRDDSSQ
jgi:hypothetical protein